MTLGLVVCEPAEDVADPRWVSVCRFDELLPERGVAALVAGIQVAIFRTFDDAVHAVGNQDPFTGTFVLSRGIVGTRGEAATVASPMHKQVFDLRNGHCLDDEAVSIPVYPVRTRRGFVEVALDGVHLESESP
jgi:nitrite reductase (NADH) small subunit